MTTTASIEDGRLTADARPMEANLEEATKAEAKAKEEHAAYSENLKAEFEEMSDQYNSKQGTLGSNDAKLSTLRGRLAALAPALCCQSCDMDAFGQAGSGGANALSTRGPMLEGHFWETRATYSKQYKHALHKNKEHFRQRPLQATKA